MARSHAPAADTTVPEQHTEPMPPVQQLQDPEKDKLLPQQEEAIQKQQATRHDVGLTDTEKGAIRATVESWLQDVAHNQLEAGAQHRLTLTISPENRYVSDRALGERVNRNNDGVNRVDSTMTGRPGLR